MIPGKKHKTLRIGQNEEITSVVDRLLKEDASYINLVIPEGAKLLQSVINLKLLKREAESLGKRIIIMTSDELGEKLAKKADMVVRKEVNEMEDKGIGAEDQTKERAEKSSRATSIPVTVSDIIKRVESEELNDMDKAGLLKEKTTKEKESDEEERKRIKEYLYERKDDELNGIQRPIKTEPIPKKRRFHLLPSFSMKLFLGFLVVSVIIAGALAVKIFPKAKLIITLAEQEVAFDQEITASKDVSKVDYENAVIPAEMLSLEKEESRKYKSTGEDEIEKKATGVITVYNELTSQSQKMIPSRFQASDGRIYWTKESIVVPGATIEDGEVVPGRVETKVDAEEAGEEYNITCSSSKPCSFTIPAWKGTVKFTKLYAKATSSIEGGKKAKVKVVTEDDIKEAKEELINELKDTLEKEIEERTPYQLKIMDETSDIEVIDANAKPNAGEEGKEFVMTVRLKAVVLVFNESDVFDLVDESLKSKILDNQNIVAEKRNVEYADVKVDFKKGKIKSLLKVKEVVRSSLNIDNFKNDLQGKSKKDMQAVFEKYKEIKLIDVTFWPFWVKSMPSKPDRIEVEFTN